MRLIRRSAFTTTRWKNGGGVTHEAVREPAGADAYLWRISVAEIAASGPFSDFAGYRRHMLLLQGDGVSLRFSNGERRSLRQVGDLAEFDGALRTECDLLGGPCADLNLMTARSTVTADARVRRLSEPVVLSARPGETLAIFCMDRALLIEHGTSAPATLGRWDLALVNASGAGIRCSADRGEDTQVFVARLARSAPSVPREDQHAR
ncbi:MAG TPA: HutD family protein [Steroidobacteraceae bacterium]|nr:HutD family protein [Steroidobacteraceae bacterium]